MRNKMSFYKKDKNNNIIQSLANALANKKADTLNTAGANFSGLSGGVSTNVVNNNSSNNDDNWGEGAGNLIKGGIKLFSGLKDSGWFNNGGSEGSGLFASAANDYISGSGTDYGIFGNAIASGGSSAGSSAVGNAISSEVGSSIASEAGSSGGWGGFGGGSGGGGGTPWGAIAGVARKGYDTIMDKDGTEYSDLEQSTIYPLQGAAIGGSYGGGWGALGGALYGLGYSFKDDIGLKDNDWLTTILFPIGMGDEHQGLIQL